MTGLRNFAVWLAIAAVCAGATVIAMKAWDGPLGLRKQIVTFGLFGKP